MVQSTSDKGSRVQSFEDLNVYKQTRDLTNKIYEITRQGSFSKDYGLVDQIRRASVSIMSNIAEGFERGTNAEFIQFLYIAKGSCGEVRAQLTIAFDQKYIDENSHKSLIDRCRRISGMLGNLITYLKSSRVQSSRDHQLKVWQKNLMRFYNRLNMKKKINKVQELKSSGVQKSTHGVSKFQSSRVPESTLKPLNPLNVEPSKEGWRLARLGEVCISTENRDPRITPDLPFRYVDISSVDNRSKRIIQARTILGKDAPSRARQLIKANDLLVATTRPNLNAVALVPEELHNEICSTGFCVLRPTEVINSLFLFFFVRTQYFIDRISGSGQVRGMLYPAVTDNQVRNVYISLPPLPEQKRIAAKLQELM